MAVRLFCALLLALPLWAHGSVTWRSTAEITSPAHGGGHNHRRGPASFHLRDGDGAEAALWSPAVVAEPLAVSGGRATARTNGLDGYHLLVARRAAAGEEQVALRYFYAPGKPSGHSPRELLEARVARLEIVPTPLPREHWRYESGKRAAFQVRFAGAPLADVPVQMVTSNGTWLEERSDAAGYVRVDLPDDFAQVRPGRAANAPAEFVLTVAHGAEGKRFTTTLGGDYHVSPAHWQTTLGGGATLALGFLAGLMLVRPGKEQQA